ncbi:outer membrane lipoprotein carrier protein LolA [Erythrobacter sp. HL-111]|uniref:LolA family protein n=1 Tax=Erythrobacter sp. HL-111 TaxID=1798193 RepID=UPI0006D99615|nr:outer membrane lipoprotein carrier protein LolA [Erythrobacter sp. HL-111]KPP94838.1 MAG: Outer membrane lipoprotein-sorting protein [Erythrobacteraceae bacterium HL-111]SDS87563.1 Outer membrane lipoprotein-sorting protein [Erythrobacter sp. HL-111]
MTFFFSGFRFRPRSVAAALALGLAGAFPLAAPLAPAAHAQQAGPGIDAAVAALRGISTMRADFTQIDRDGRRVSGTMTLKRPGKIRFDYGRDSDFLVVSNGKSLYVVDYEVKQVERYPIRRSPLGALLDPSRDVAKYGKLVPTAREDVLSVEVRDPSRPEFGVITMIFVKNARAPGGWELNSWVALDAQDHRTTVRLSNHRYGLSVAESTFDFDDPRPASRRPR